MSLLTSILVLIAAVVVLVHFLKSKNTKSGQTAPGPRPWPIIGNLAYIGKFRDVLDAFNSLKKEYGSVASLKLGVHNSLVICGLKNFREVLVDKAQCFDARPAFKRYYMLFGGNKDNSLAFADGNDAHHKHRAAISHHTFAKNGTANYENLENATTENVFRFIENMKTQVLSDPKIDAKSQIAESVALIFIKFFTNVDCDPSNPLFQDMVKSFDVVFQEINTGCVGDVLPFLMPFINKREYADLNAKIRAFTEKECFAPILKGKGEKDENNNGGVEDEGEEKESNVINSLLNLVENNEDVTLEHVYYAFEDILGGHSAVSNSLIRILYYVAKNPEVQEKIREEVESQASSGFPTLSDRLTYTEATIWEAFRFISSPIVPHVATQDTTIDDTPVNKGTVVFFNNFDMNFSPDLWENADSFNPQRFISPEGRIMKPEYFLPFSTGKRSCLGYRMAINICRVVVANLCQNFQIELDPQVDYEMERGVIATGRGKEFPFIYKPVAE